MKNIRIKIIDGIFQWYGVLPNDVVMVAKTNVDMSDDFANHRAAWTLICVALTSAFEGTPLMSMEDVAQYFGLDKEHVRKGINQHHYWQSSTTTYPFVRKQIEILLQKAA